MIALLCFVLAVLAAPFKSKSRLEAENAALRRQLIVLRRKVQGRVRLTNNDRWILIQLYRWLNSEAATAIGQSHPQLSSSHGADYVPGRPLPTREWMLLRFLQQRRGARVVEKETQHLTRGVGASRIGVGS